jgi:protein O-GlcNAc transferase
MRGPSLFAAAVAVHDLDRPGDARKTYLQQLGISPDSADAHYGLGVLLMQIGHLNEGLSHLHRALEINPANGTHWLGFIRALAVSGRIDEAHQTLTQGRQRGLDGEPVVRIQNFLKAATLGINRVRDLLVDASQLEVKGCSEDALRMYQLAYEIRPHDPAISERIGDLLNALYRSEEAEIAFNRVVNLTPNSELGFIGLGMSLFAQGKVLEAIAAYGSAIALNGSNPTAHALMGAAQDQIGNAKEAEAEYRRALGDQAR